MKYNKIQNTDLEVSAISLGTWVFGGDMWSGAKEEDCLKATQAAIDLGVNLIDTAPIYGRGLSEKIVGKAIKGQRDKVIIATKCGPEWEGKAITINLSPATIRKQVDESLQRLKIDVIDLYQCHWPDPKTPIEQTMEELLKIKDEGKIRYIGVSNFDRPLIKKAAELAGVVTLQSQYSLLDRSLDKEILPFCREKEIGLLAYGPLGGGILTGKYQSEPKFARSDARSFFYKYYKGKNFQECQAIIETLKEIGRPVNQTAINWVRQQEGVASAILGCRNAEQVKANVAAADWDLTEEELQRIEAVRYSGV